MKLYGLGNGLFSAGSRGGGFSAAPRGGFSAAHTPTVHPVMTSQPGMYGGPPGSFITKGRGCPPGYMPSPLSRGETRCIPRVAAPAAPPPPRPPPAPAPPVTVSPTITVSPVMQQEFTPQFSPVMTMQQDSPGAAVAATPVQTAASPQVARTAAHALVPMAPSTPYEGPALAPIPMLPEATIPAATTPPMPMPMRAGWPTSPELETAIAEEQEKGLPLGLILAAAGIGLFLVTRKPQKGKTK